MGYRAICYGHGSIDKTKGRFIRTLHFKHTIVYKIVNTTPVTLIYTSYYICLKCVAID